MFRYLDDSLDKQTQFREVDFLINRTDFLSLVLMLFDQQSRYFLINCTDTFW